jgi:hypothetical protein
MKKTKLWTARDTKRKKLQQKKTREATQRPWTPSFAMKHKIQTSLLVAQTTPKTIHHKNSQIFGMILCIKASNGLPNSDVKTRNLKSQVREQMRARFCGDSRGGLGDAMGKKPNGKEKKSHKRKKGQKKSIVKCEPPIIFIFIFI